MPKGIFKPVGKGGANEWRDVKLVQYYINAYDLGKRQPPKLTTDGKIGKNTLKAIEIFQKYAVGMNYPDLRVDPNGSTFRHLTMFHSVLVQQEFENSLTKPTAPKKKISLKTVRANAGLSSFTVVYKGVPSSKQKVSEYAKDVVRLALKESGMKAAAITSTIRSPKEQASIMLRNAKKNYQKQLDLYGSNGEEVLKVYNANKTLSDEKIIDLMVKKIEELMKNRKVVSRHCATKESYKKKNIFDIGLNSTRALNSNFDKMKFTKALKNLKKQGYIDDFIDETGKSNTCWHIEVIPNIKSIPYLQKGLLLNPIVYINGMLA